MNVALLGFGTVGFGVYDILKNKDGVNVTYVLDLVKHEGLTAKSVTDINEILSDSSVDTVVELIGGMHPSVDFITASLKAGKNVITANKFVICEHYEELTTLARENKVALRYTAAVGGGIQWLVNLERMIRSDIPKKICGIMNGTTNYILDSMHTSGEDFNNALASAQKLGYAEADPSADIDGLDALRKIVISSNIAFSKQFNSEDVDVLGIRNVFSSDIKAAEEMGCVCRLLTNSEKTEKGISVWVEPSFVSDTSVFASVKQNLNYISAESEYAGISGYFGYGAGRYPTAYTVVNDILDVAAGKDTPYNTTAVPSTPDNSLVKEKYYIRTTANDEWLSSVTEGKLGNGIITKEISVSLLHSNIKRISMSDPACFAAAIREGV